MQVRRTFSASRAWRPTVGAGLTRTLGHAEMQNRSASSAMALAAAGSHRRRRHSQAKATRHAAQHGAVPTSCMQVKNRPHPATTSKSTKISTQRYSRPRRQHTNHRSPVCGARLARQCCAWQSEGCVLWRASLWRRWPKQWRSNDSTADAQGRALKCAHGQRHEIQVTQRAAREA